MRSSPVTAEILPAPTPPSTTQPRVVAGPNGLKYRFVNGRFEHNIAHALANGWLSSEFNARTINEIQPSTLSMLADLKANPTETITPPAGEDTVVLRMPRSTADTLTRLVGNVIGGGPIRAQLDEVFDVLDNALDPTGTGSTPMLFDEVTSIREEFQK